jgi:hypothetical protein
MHPHLVHSCYMPWPSHLPWRDLWNYNMRRSQVMKSLIMQLHPPSSHFIPLRSTPSVCDSPVMSETKFRTHTEPQTTLEDLSLHLVQSLISFVSSMDNHSGSLCSHYLNCIADGGSQSYQ